MPHVETYDCDACDGLGRLASVNVADRRPRTVTFTNAPTGQVLARIETSAAANNPADYYYFVDGVQVGELSNNGNHDLSRATYSETFVTRNWNFNNNLTSQPFRWNTTGGVTRGQFGGSGYDPISPESNGMQGTDSRYTVREGDTLQGIAASLWGDSSLWYMIAEANGLTGAQSLAAGTSLRIPDKVTNIHNSARTFEVYDPNRALPQAPSQGAVAAMIGRPPASRQIAGVAEAITSSVFVLRLDDERLDRLSAHDRRKLCAKTMSYRDRLAEERRRPGRKQAHSRRSPGATRPSREPARTTADSLPADYLARAASPGADVLYVPTGRRRRRVAGRAAERDALRFSGPDKRAEAQRCSSSSSTFEGCSASEPARGGQGLPVTGFRLAESADQLLDLLFVYGPPHAMCKTMSFGERLAEERRRLGHKQAHFAALVGSDPPKQSLYENNHRQLRADYLARVHAVGVDILYVLTGQRCEGEWLGEQGSAILSAYLGLPEELRPTVLALVEDLARLFPR